MYACVWSFSIQRKKKKTTTKIAALLLACFLFFYPSISRTLKTPWTNISRRMPEAGSQLSRNILHRLSNIHFRCCSSNWPCIRLQFKAQSLYSSSDTVIVSARVELPVRLCVCLCVYVKYTVFVCGVCVCVCVYSYTFHSLVEDGAF